MTSRIILLLLLVLFQSTAILYGQNSTWKVKGIVVGNGSQPLRAATVSLVSQDNRTVLKTATDSNGLFVIDHSLQDIYNLRISYTGYQEYTSASFQPENKDLGVITLSIKASELDEVVVQSKQSLIELNANSISYNVSKSIDAQGVSALEALRKAPGVFVSNDNAISLNGKGGVMILIDGRQTYLSGQELVDLLKSMPASGIKSFEIINNPSAKYDASGSAGIINIKMNKSQIKGLSGTATVGIAYGISARQHQDLSFHYKRNKYTIYGSYNHFIGHSNYVYGSDRLQSEKTYQSATDDTDKRKRLGTRLGMDYSLNKNNTIGVLVNGNFIIGGGITQTETKEALPHSSLVERILNAENDYYYQQTNRYNVNLNYKYENAAGKIINVDADYGSFTKGNGNLQSNIYRNNSNTILSQNLYHSLNDIGINLKALKFDYTKPLWGGSLETGAKYSTVVSDNAAEFFHVLPNRDSLDDQRSNTFDFREQIVSTYLNYKKTIGKWSLQGGLRLENANSEGALFFTVNHRDSSQATPRNYTNLFPSFSVSVKPSATAGFSLSYSNRIDRPAYQDLNPFIYLLDELSFWQGNPFLQPQLTHRAALQYVYKNATVIGLSFSYTNHFSTRVTDTIERIKIVMIPRNLGIQKNIALSITQNLTLAKWWEVTFNGLLYQLHNKAAFDQYRKVNLKQMAGRVNLQQRFKLPYAIKGEVSGYFNSKRLTGANEISRGTSQIDIGVQRNFLKEKATLRLSLSDLYRGNKVRSVQQIEGFYLSSYGYYESRQVRLNFTYKLTNSNDKGPRNRSSALENENGRIK